MDDRTQPPLNTGMPVTIFDKDLTGNFYVEEDIDLNEVVQSALQKSSGDRKDWLILRSDKLPLVCGSRYQVAQLFEAIVSMIINHPPANSKLFLYIKCVAEERDPEVLDLRLSPGYGMYQLHFYTNITTGSDWQLVYKDQLVSCGLTAQDYKGSFAFHPISNTGCLFSLTLPGKIS